MWSKWPNIFPRRLHMIHPRRDKLTLRCIYGYNIC